MVETPRFNLPVTERIVNVKSCIYSSFACIEQPVAEQLDNAAGASFDQSLDWYGAMAELVLGSDESLQLVSVTDGNYPAMLPLVTRRHPGSGIVGQAIGPLANYYTAYFGPLIADGADSSASVRQLARTVLKDLPRWHTLDVNPVAQEDSWVDEFAAELRDSGCYISSYFRFGNWYLEVGGRNFDEYFASLPGKLRNTVKRKDRKLQREADVRLEVIKDTDALDEALEDYRRIYALSWKQAEPFPDFIDAICRRYAGRGWLRLGRLLVDGAPAASQIWFVRNGTASIFKLAYDPQFSQYSVGSILTTRLMQNVIDEDKVEIVDYLCGDDAYKRDWMSHRRERSGLRVYRLGSPLGLCRAGIDSAVKALRKLGRESRGTEVENVDN